MIFKPEKLTFSQGEQVAYFTVTLIEGAVSGYVKFSLTGEAKDAYKLIREAIPFQSLPLNIESPYVKSARLYTLTRTSAEVYVQSSELSLIHYVYTPVGTNPPLVQMLVKGETMWSDATQKYGKTWTDRSKGVAIISMDGLIDNTAYSLFYVIQDRSNHTSLEIETFNFKSLPTHLPAKFRIYVTSISTVEQVRYGVAQALSFPLKNVLDTGIDPALGITRRVLIEQRQLYYEFSLFVDRTSSLDKPINYVNNLDFNVDRLAKYVPFFNTSTKVSTHSSEYSYLSAQFDNPINITSITLNTVNVKTVLNVAGAVYGIILSNDKKAPNSVQIKNGFDAHNIKVKQGRYAYASVEYGQIAEIEFSSLTEHDEMVVYLTAENDLPGNPELMDDEFIAAKPIVVGSYIDSAFVYIFRYLNSGTSLVISLFSILLI